MKATDLIGIIIGIVLLCCIDYSFSLGNGIFLFVACILVTKALFYILTHDDLEA